MGWAAERWRLYGLALSEAGRGLATWARLSARGPRLRVPRPERLLFAPQDLRTSDPTVAQDIYGGLFVLGGRAVETRGRSPFELTGSEVSVWSEALYGFEWLRHLRAADTPLAREHARALVLEAIGPRRRELERGTGRRTDVVARRLVSFLCQSPLVLNGADHVFYGRFLRAIGGGVAALERDVVASRVPLRRLNAAIGLSYAALCCSGFENRLRRATRLLSAELDAQILPDGGHVNRNPGTLVQLLLDLLPLRLLYASRNVETPDALRRAIDRMMPMLRYLRHADGELALFNGAGATAVDHVATLLSYDSVRGSPPAYAEQSGYARLEAGATVVIADTGPAPPLVSSAAAHAGCLSFELAADGGRLVVNVGAPRTEARSGVAFRSTAAHSTLALGDASSAVPLDADGPVADWLERRLGPVLVNGPDIVSVERNHDADSWAVVTARHDGFAGRFGLIHERRWRLDPAGSCLEGEDRLLSGGKAGEAGPDRVLRFHLLPSVSVSATSERELRLDRPGRKPWRFSAETGQVSVEESLYFGGAEGWRPTSQIVLRAPPDGIAPIRWRFARVADPQTANLA